MRGIRKNIGGEEMERGGESDQKERGKEKADRETLR